MFEGFYQSDYWFSLYLIQRGLGLIYLLAFLVSLNQFLPLLGEKGLLPVPRFLSRISFKRTPSIFHWHYSDRMFLMVTWAGIFLSLLAVTGLSDSGPLWLSMLTWFLLWALYLSVVNVGQIFYGYGWESLLLEAGFYAIFFGPIHFYAPLLIIFVLRWLVIRVEFGAGLIKMRGDPCWRNLTCMNYHHETQPMPNPLSWFFHHVPQPLHKIETFFNHLVQLGVVWLLLAPQPIASYAALFIVITQLYLLVSGNYAWLNLITLILAFSGFSDSFLGQFITFSTPAELAAPVYFQIMAAALAAVVFYMSINPVQNMISPDQRMNFSFNPLHLVNTYGAFGSVTKKRHEVIIEGTNGDPNDPDSEWKEYEFKGKPGNPERPPPQIAPYHLRLDWQIWFAAMMSIRTNPWLVRFVLRLLQGYTPALKLLKKNPFPDKPPKYIRAQLYHYRYSSRNERKKTGRWWIRTFVREYMPAQSLQDLKSKDF